MENDLCSPLLKQDFHDEIIHSLPLGGTIGDKQLHDHVTDVTQLLLEHGVWPDRAADRTHQVMTKISHATLRNIVASTRSWAELKACQPCTQTHHDR